MAHHMPVVPSGLPLAAAGQQPLLAALAAVTERPEDEGKGERATRISHHLRATSRHRSVSPPANRSMDAESSTVPMALNASSPPAPIAALDVGAASLSPPLHTRSRRLSLDDSHPGSASPIHSPRPMLSPKASFAREPPAVHGSLAKSERVAALEELAGAADALHGDMSADLPASALADAAAALAKDKTLPGPPVPSGKPPSSQPSRPRADTLFVSASQDEDSAITPPTPALVAFSPGRHGYARASPAMLDALTPVGGESGLDALERKLLAQVGTRKVEKEESRMDVRDLALSVNAATNANVATPITIPPRKSNGLDTPMGDSAISSLTLSNGLSVGEGPAPVAAMEMKGGLSPGMRRTLGARLSAENVRRAERSHSPSPSPSPGPSPRASPPGTPRSPPSAEKVRMSKESKASSRKEREPGSEGAFKMRKAAKGRVAAWLENITPDVPPQVDSIASSPEPTVPPPIVYSNDDDDDSSSEGGKTNKAKSRPVSPEPKYGLSRKTTIRAPETSGTKTARGSPTKQSSPPRPESKASQAPPKEDVSAAPNPRSSGFVPIGSVKQQFTRSSKSPRLPVFPPPASSLATPEVKYDVRSARGGRGGKVAAVASIWGAKAEKDGQTSTPKPVALPTPIFKPSVTRSPSAPSMKQQGPNVTKPNAPPESASPNVKDILKTPTVRPVNAAPKWSDVAKKAPVPRLARPTPFAEPAKARPAPPVAAKPNVGELTTNRARMIKSTSVPAVVSSSLATPMLSSTASLSRPAPSSPAIALPGLARARGTGPWSPKTESPPTVSLGVSKAAAPSATNGNQLREGLRNIAASPVPKPTSPEPTENMAFGQARLRELIKKYQGQK